jgi:hypothetical protein
MTKSETIQAICRLNHTAEPEFLSEFTPDELTRYLQRLSDRPLAGAMLTSRSEWREPTMRVDEPQLAMVRAPTE